MRLALASLALVLLLLTALGAGERAIAPGLILSALRGDPVVPPDIAFIITELRLPRALLAMLAGAALALAGALAQAAMRNSLAEPGLIGINGGAALAAMVLLVLFPASAAFWLPWAALAGALGMAALIQILSLRFGMRSQRMILIGLALGAVAGGLSAFLSAMGDITAVQRAMLWMAGSLQDSRWEKLHLLLLWLAPLAALALGSARLLDLLGFEDEQVTALGLPSGPLRAAMLALCAALAGAVVAATGPIGFVGLAAPHMARRLVGPLHRHLLPVAALTGAGLLLLADTLGRSLVAPAQIPAGIVSALIGAPFFGWLVWRHRDD
ncbi:FecCD family ABC transporter permease [Pseudogemmobacter sonorensis]|uniref:FecCD family ABC transporter permease n=1 Tax=Pseudogemmobacter sonorensis TaxID=2989681 RepID=UPI003682B0BF